MSTSELPFLPYGHQSVDDDDIAAVAAVLRSDYLTGGPAVQAFEDSLVATTGAGHAAACSTGTAALHMAYAALGAGPGDCVVVPSITFLATANAAHYVGAAVEFADVDPDTGQMMPAHAAAAIERAKARGLTVKILTPVYLSGQCGDPEGMAALAAANGAVVVEDACHALGTTYLDAQGQRHKVGAGTHAAATSFSFHPVKTIAMGEGGAVLTPSATLAEKVRLLRSHGMTRDPDAFLNQRLAFEQRNQGALDPQSVNPWYYEMQALGNNYRASDIHCALGASQLTKLDHFVARRRALMARYAQALPAIPGVQPVPHLPNCEAAWHLNVALIDFDGLGVKRADVMRSLQAQGIGSQVHYMPIPWHPYWAPHCTDQGPWPGAQAYYDRCLSLPLFPAMTDADVDRVIAALRTALGQA